MKVYIICHLLVALYWSTTSMAQEVANMHEKNTQELADNKTNEGAKENPESGESKKFFFLEDVHDDFYPKPHFPTLFYPFIHHHDSDHYEPDHYEPDHYEPDHYEPDHYEPDHYEPDHYEPDHYEPDHYDKPKPPVHKPPPKPIHKPEHHKPPIVIHHKPIHKPVHIHIHKPSLHALKPPHKPILHEHIHKPIHHEHHHKPVHHEEHHKPVQHKPHKDDCDSNCTGTKIDDGVETDFSEDEVYEISADEDDTKYSVDQDSDQTYLYSQVEPAGNFEKYDINYSTEPYNNSSKPISPPANYLSGGSGTRKPIVSLSDFLSHMRPVPWYSQHQEEKGPVRKPLSEDISHHSNSNPDHDKPHNYDHKKPCHVHHHYHYYYPTPHQPYPHYPHVPHHPPSKPHVPSYYPKDDSRASSTESTLAETVDPKITIPYNEYDVSTKAPAEEEKPEEESHSPKPTRKPKPKTRPISQMLLWPFTPKPERTRASKKPQTTEHDKKKEESTDEKDGEEDNIFSDFFELK